MNINLPPQKKVFIFSKSHQAQGGPVAGLLDKMQEPTVPSSGPRYSMPPSPLETYRSAALDSWALVVFFFNFYFFNMKTSFVIRSKKVALLQKRSWE